MQRPIVGHRGIDVLRTLADLDEQSVLAAGDFDRGGESVQPCPIKPLLAREDAFAIELAVAGFSEDDLDIETKDGLLTISGKHAASDEGNAREFLHRGIAERGFIRRYQLADHVIVTGAELKNGLLRIELLRELPEAKKPRKIEIGTARKRSKPRVIEGKKGSAA